MKYQHTLRLLSDEPIEPDVLEGLHLLLSQCGVDVFFVDEAFCLEECKEMILTRGVRQTLSTGRILEAILAKTDDHEKRDLLIRVLRDQLRTLAPSESLIVVDPYFFPANLRDKGDYLDDFRAIFGSVIPGINRITFITKPRYDAGLFEDMKRILVEINPALRIEHRTTNDFHDRWWIADRERGLFIGTSLNGLGKRYALTDYLKDDDAAQIVDELEKAELI
jgi:hypothetical protein